MVNTPTIRLDMPETEYHSHPALSSTGARRILDSPARFNYWQKHPQPGKQSFDVGTAVHTKVLGIGAGTIAYPDEHVTASGAVSTKAATVAWAEEQRALGLTPVAPAQAARIDGMAEAVLKHETAGPLFERGGHSETSVFSTDEDTGVDMRARFDYLALTDQSVAVDLKTTAKTASVDGFTRTVADYGYDVQQEHYLRALGQRIPFVFVVVEAEAPHLVGVHTLDIEWARMGEARVQRALELYATCTASGIWPGYPAEPQLISPPNWLVYQHEDEYGPVETTTVRHL
ncbi:PD-(D/E)XK nuclease-like domain-containing protein [Curtobacterium flaccumfaciens pv. flaccumfaciens]|uniref:PD-(D/E)XK nuclease-like domain-containing protein n=1 Tax=Curtobacterium flaccumfaciens TaxID=2035 RepID=UPI00217DE628|nr:PD-(D/E)XK nuclease-like domain-containing protein [Curtobacterium flaccumfaciens]MCS6570296.1 PD-(D/E)XK nuclease-like domain-containing protein [Curtobacterium flaccumfaciens pv. flaccumfaciens]MCS6585152.1 PD-(D/E)XK nuclease-like domain-containing protein [Curtobacterium flaccumfaciens pv. flaccumfaciens]